MQGGPLMHTIAAKATCFRIAATEAFRDYQRQVRANADALSDELQTGGLDVLTGGTDTHLLQVDLRATDWTGQGRRGAARRGEAHRQPQHRAVRRAQADHRVRESGSGPRRRRCAASTRRTAARSARIICGALDASSRDLDDLRARAEALCAKRPLYPGLGGFPTYA